MDAGLAILSITLAVMEPMTLGCWQYNVGV